MLKLVSYFTNIKTIKFISKSAVSITSKEIFPFSSEICSLEIPELNGMELNNIEAGIPTLNITFQL